MKTFGMIRKVDALGRIVIPSELRQAMELQQGDALELYEEESRLVMKKFAPASRFCGGIQRLVTYEGKNICGKCVRVLRQG